MDAMSEESVASIAERDERQHARLSKREGALLALARSLKEEGYRFTTPTPATHARVNARPSNEWAAGTVDVFGWSRPFREQVLPPSLFALMRTSGVALRHGEGWRSLIRLSTLGDHLFIHSAFPTTDSDAVFFGPDTYRFASALTCYLEHRIEPVGRAVDVGCGAGPGAILIAHKRPNAEVFAVDINHVALRLTAINAALAATPNVVPHHSNLMSAVGGHFDLIVANPPYLLDARERSYRHGGGELGEGISLAIVEAAMERLAPGGALLLYTGVAIVDGTDRFRAAVAARLERAGVEWDYREIDPDVFGEELSEPAYAGTDRIAAVLATVTRTR